LPRVMSMRSSASVDPTGTAAHKMTRRKQRIIETIFIDLLSPLNLPSPSLETTEPG
jgi:hypothetical protein